jgi:F0F1-type ATP synthase epsilon subunit
MLETKKWYSSKTIWGIAIAALGILLTNVLKVDIVLPSDATVDQGQTAIQAIKAAQGNIGVIGAQVITLVGLVVGVIGRIKAEKKIS